MVNKTEDSPKVADKPVKLMRKSLSSAPVKSKIPKQGKLPIPTVRKASTRETMSLYHYNLKTMKQTEISL
jgi:hypothetical protein